MFGLLVTRFHLLVHLDLATSGTFEHYSDVRKMSMIQSDPGPKRCDSCNKQHLLEFFTCSACPPQSNPNSYDLCVSCCNHYAREAHQENHGPNHVFVFARRPRWCDWCRDPITGDFMMCKECPQDLNCYDLCLTCTMSRRPAQLHSSSLQHNELRYVKWLPPDSPGEMKPFQTFRLNWQWNCDGNRPQCPRQVFTPFFHCLDCRGNGFDLCSCCADNGGIFRHRKETGHRFAFIMQTKPVPKVSVTTDGHDDAPPPYRDW